MPVSALDSLDGLAAAPGKRRFDRDIRGSGAEGFRWLKVGDDGLLWWNVVLDDEIVERSVAAAAGLVVERARFLLGPIAIHWVTVAAFFVTGRHRLLVVGPLAVLAALAVGEALERWRAGARRPVLWAAGATLAGALLLSAGPLLAAAPRAYAGELAAEEAHFTGTVLLVEEHQPAAAMAALERALVRLPSRASTWFNLG